MLNQYTRYATILLLLAHADLVRADLMTDITQPVTATQTSKATPVALALRSTRQIATGEFQHSQFNLDLENITTISNKNF
ncbi:MAG: hypothetical protein ACI831_000175 [Candidatus Azotimanducaceae bacterium]|jgi:hypothetical protein